jgi:uncharacterized repeat protein (TIGR03847 family)
MPRELFFFDDPERIVIGTVGVPGEREFFLQLRQGKEIRSFALEKSQASALAERCSELLKEIPAFTHDHRDDSAPLDTPIESEFSIGVMTLTWRTDLDLIVLEAQAISNGSSDTPFEEIIDDDAPDAPPILRAQLLPNQLRAFVKRTQQVVSAGRVPCIFCGGPVNPGGHLCPRANGYRRTT